MTTAKHLQQSIYCSIDERTPELRDARRGVYEQDQFREARETHLRVKGFMADGYSARETAALLGITQRHVVRLRTTEPYEPPQLAFDDSDARADDLEELALVALRFVGLIRDENPAYPWDALSRMTRQRLQELTLILAAMVPVDKTRAELLAWVRELPAAVR